MTEIHRLRLLQLINHLESGKLGHKRFSFEVFTTAVKPENICGSAGCAIGECPIVFPEDWEFRRKPKKSMGWPIEPRLKASKKISSDTDPCSLSDAAEFFGVNYDTSLAMFTPDYDEEDAENNAPDATREQVAQHLRTFL